MLPDIAWTLVVEHRWTCCEVTVVLGGVRILVARNLGSLKESAVPGVALEYS